MDADAGTLANTLPMTRRAKSRATRAPRADGVETRVRILEAAGRLFAASGYADTTAKAIAKRAKVSLASINYHFDGRQGLYRAVLIEAHRRIVSLDTLQDLAVSDLTPAARLRWVIEQLVRQAADRRAGWHMDVLAREILSPSVHLNVLLRAAVQPKLAVIMQVISDLTGIPPGDPALLRCMLSALAPCTVLLLVARGVAGPLQEIRQMPHDQVASHLHAFALAGLEAIGRERRRRRGMRVD